MTGKVGASISAQPATATKSLLLPQLLFQDTSAPATPWLTAIESSWERSKPSQDNPNHSQGHGHQPSSATKGSLPVQSFHEETQQGDKRSVPLGGKKKSNHSTWTKNNRLSLVLTSPNKQKTKSEVLEPTVQASLSQAGIQNAGD